MGKRVNPFSQGTPEHTLFAAYRKNKLEAERVGREAAMLAVDAEAARAKAEEYANALRAIGKGDKVEPLPQLPDYSNGGGS